MTKPTSKSTPTSAPRKGSSPSWKSRRQAIIHQVVTRGLDPNVRLKPSGVEWLGHVPEHWEVKPLKQWVTINEAVLPETTGPDFHFRYLEIGAVTAGEILEEPKKIKFADAPSRARRIVKSSDTIVSTVRTYLKAIWFAERLEEPLICSTGFAVITPREGTVPRFVSYIIQDTNFTDRITAESTGTGYPAISESRLAALKVCVPSASEQAQIIQQLDGVTTSLNESIKHARRQIELMGEYRTRLIADVVTGKLDVRKAAEKTFITRDGRNHRLIPRTRPEVTCALGLGPRKEPEKPPTA